VFPVRYENYPSCDLNKKAEPKIMSRILTVTLIYHLNNPIDLVSIKCNGLWQ
jgi:hypothetical protein